MTSEKKKIPINSHHAVPDGGRAEDVATGNSDDSGARGGADQGSGRIDETVCAEEALRADQDAGADQAGEGGSALETDPLELVTAERDAYLDSLRRLQAEFDNYRRRSQRESSEVRTRARCGVLGEFLPVFDSLSRALDAAEHHEEGKVLDGVRLTHSLFADLLRREGVEEMHPLGSAFDPRLHEAIASLPSHEAEGTVVSVVEKGYAAGDAVLRPARVAVSAGPSGGAVEE